MIYILLILLSLALIIYFYNNRQYEEHFQWDPLWVGQTSLDCYGENEQDCLNYSNCGLSKQWDGTFKCQPGDENGAFFDEDNSPWKYANYYDRHIFNEKVTSVMQPWDKFQPGFEVRFPSPIVVSTLQ